MLGFVEEAVGGSQLLLGERTLLCFPGVKRLPESIVPESRFECLRHPARYADAAIARSLTNLACDL